MLKPFRLLYGLLKESWNFGKQEHAILLQRNQVQGTSRRFACPRASLPGPSTAAAARGEYMRAGLRAARAAWAHHECAPLKAMRWRLRCSSLEAHSRRAARGSPAPSST